VERFRVEMTELFDDFVVRATVVMDRYIDAKLSRYRSSVPTSFNLGPETD